MEIRLTTTSSLQTNTYLIIDEESNGAVLVDPGEDVKYLISWVEESGAILKAILVTHCHYDHIGAVDRVSAYFNVPVYTHKEEAEGMLDPHANLSIYFLQQKVRAKADQFVEDGERIDFGGGLCFICLIVPGHSQKSVCYYNPEYDFVISGDTLMAGSVGRADFYKGDSYALIENIENKLLTLPDETIVYPGHGYKTTVIIEKNSNPFLA